MSTDTTKILKSTFEQAIAAWTGFLNQLRFEELVLKLHEQDINLEKALSELDELKKFLGDPSHILGSSTTKHGEIAEHMQVNFSNARKYIQGLEATHTFEGVGRTAPEDYLCEGQQVQSKFYNGLKKTFFGKHALSEHMETYPDFLKKGGNYDIPKDQYEKLLEILDAYENNPSSLSTSDYNLAKKVDDFLKSNNLELGKDIKPAVVGYEEVQQGVANDTVEKEEKSIKKEDQNRRKEAYENSKPSLKEGLKVTGVSAVIEGGVAFCTKTAKIRKRKQFSDFTTEDWKEIGIDTGSSTVKGAIRGASIYTLTNFTRTPANVATAYMTAFFGITAQIKALRNSQVTEEDFIINCETVCLDVTISAISAAVGQAFIPVPVLGAVIGNIVGSFVYEICKEQGIKQTDKTLAKYAEEIESSKNSSNIMELQMIKKEFEKFNSLEVLAFDKNTNIAFFNSIQLAEEVNVPKGQILHNLEKTNEYFSK